MGVKVHLSSYEPEEQTVNLDAGTIADDVTYIQPVDQILIAQEEVPAVQEVTNETVSDNLAIPETYGDI